MVTHRTRPRSAASRRALGSCAGDGSPGGAHGPPRWPTGGGHGGLRGQIGPFAQQSIHAPVRSRLTGDGAGRAWLVARWGRARPSWYESSRAQRRVVRRTRPPKAVGTAALVAAGFFTSGNAWSITAAACSPRRSRRAAPKSSGLLPGSPPPAAEAQPACQRARPDRARRTEPRLGVAETRAVFRAEPDDRTPVSGSAPLDYEV